MNSSMKIILVLAVAAVVGHCSAVQRSQVSVNILGQSFNSLVDVGALLGDLAQAGNLTGLTTGISQLIQQRPLSSISAQLQTALTTLVAQEIIMIQAEAATINSLLDSTNKQAVNLGTQITKNADTAVTSIVNTLYNGSASNLTGIVSSITSTLSTFTSSTSSQVLLSGVGIGTDVLGQFSANVSLLFGTLLPNILALISTN